MATVLVKIGSGLDSSFVVALDELRRMDRMALLRAFAGDVGFAAKLKGIALDDCKVFLLQTAAGSMPTAEEEAGTTWRR